MKLEIKEVDHGWDNLRKELGRLSAGDSYAKAGIVGAKGAANHKAASGGGEALNNAELAMVHEFGLGVPERSFIRAAFDKNRPKYLSMLERLMRAVYDKKITLRRALTLLAMECSKDMRAIIIDGPGVPPPNAPATIARKGSSRPLVDTAQMKNAIGYEVSMEGDDQGT